MKRLLVTVRDVPNLGDVSTSWVSVSEDERDVVLLVKYLSKNRVPVLNIIVDVGRLRLSEGEIVRKIEDAFKTIRDMSLPDVAVDTYVSYVADLVMQSLGLSLGKYVKECRSTVKSNSGTVTVIIREKS